MHRQEVINTLIEWNKGQTYLEIGVSRGVVLDKVICKNKIGVDPCFLFSTKLKIKRLLGLSRFQTYECTSNVFFEKYAKKILNHGVDVVLVDGLHTYEQAKKDIDDTLLYLNENGVIVVHDCNPLNAAAAYPVKESIDEVLEKVQHWDLEGWQGQWNGDVWKAIADLMVTRDDLRIFTLNMDFGLAIVMKGTPEHRPGFTLNEIQNGDYAFFNKNREELLNLKEPKYFKQVFFPDIKK